MLINLDGEREKFGLSPVNSDEQIRRAWRTLLADIGERPWLMRLWRKKGTRLLERFAQAYRSLLALSRQRRRALLRKAGTGLAGAALFLALAGGTPVFADTITVDGTCTLIDAITAANTNATVNSCTHSGAAGADTLNLTVDVTLTARDNSYNGLPQVSSEITINGNGHTISRGGGSPNFRIFEVSSTGDLTLNNATVSGGDATYEDAGAIKINGGAVELNSTTLSGNTGYLNGGAIRISSGTLTLNDSTVSGNNTTFSGGGIFSYNSTVTFNHSTISNNTAGSSGGGIYGQSGSVTINNSTISGNYSSGIGGGVVQSFSGTMTINNSTLSNNTSASSGGGVAASGAPITIESSTISGNTADSDNGGGVFNLNTTVTIRNSTITGNSAGNVAGGI